MQAALDELLVDARGRARTIDRRPADLAAIARNVVDDAAVVVTDHGAGVPPEDQDRVFERFWRGRPDTPGTGLGLPIARQIAAAHGGSLTVRSPGPDGDGSVFTLRLRR